MDDRSVNRGGLRRHAAAAALLAASTLYGCTNFKGTTATSFLKQIRQDPDPNSRFIVYQKLASPYCYDNAEQKAQAVKVLVAKLEEGKEPIATRAVICRTLGDLKSKAARPALINAVSDNDAIVRVQACRALGKVGTPEDATILCRVMTVDSLEDCRIAAIEGLGELKSRDPRILEMLIDGMENDDPAIRLASLTSLKQITGKNAGVETAAWRKELKPLLEAPNSVVSPVVTEPPVPKDVYPPLPNPPAVLRDEAKIVPKS